MRETTRGSGIVATLRRWAEPLARIGCVAVGTVYALIGGVALVALTGRLIEYADPYRIVLLLKRLPAGVVLIWAITIGAAAYAAWRIIEAWTDPYDIGAGWVERMKRVAVALSGLAYALLAYSTARVAFLMPAIGRDAPEQEQQQLVARVFSWPAGSWLIGAAGVAIAAAGLMQFWLVLRGSYTRDIRIQALTKRGELMVRILGAYGYSARGVILCVLGYFFVQGAVSRNPSVVGDTDTAFDFIGGGVVGDTAFAIVALGTVAYGLLMYVNALWYKFDAEHRPDRYSRHGHADDA